MLTHQSGTRYPFQPQQGATRYGTCKQRPLRNPGCQGFHRASHPHPRPERGNHPQTEAHAEQPEYRRAVRQSRYVRVGFQAMAQPHGRVATDLPRGRRRQPDVGFCPILEGQRQPLAVRQVPQPRRGRGRGPQRQRNRGYHDHQGHRRARQDRDCAERCPARLGNRRVLQERKQPVRHARRTVGRPGRRTRPAYLHDRDARGCRRSVGRYRFLHRWQSRRHRCGSPPGVRQGRHEPHATGCLPFARLWKPSEPPRLRRLSFFLGGLRYTAAPISPANLADFDAAHPTTAHPSPPAKERTPRA